MMHERSKAYRRFVVPESKAFDPHLEGDFTAARPETAWHSLRGTRPRRW